ncbi:MAG: Hint domain-containing protein [Myxococcaceae bacterium]
MRCKTFGDSLDSAQAIERREWAWKCFPIERWRINLHDQILDETTSQLVEGYPTFAVVADNDGTKISNPKNWFAPINRDADCAVPTDYKLITFCGAGCYTPEQKVWFKDGYEAIGEAHAQNFLEIMTLTSSSVQSDLKFELSGIEYFITDFIAGTHEVLNIYTLSGGSLRVTLEHPLVDSEGRMRSANSLGIGDALVMANGDFDPIISIEPEQYVGKVYNVEVKNKNPSEKIIVAQGYLNGTVYYQNEGIRELNRVILRSNLIPDSLVR